MSQFQTAANRQHPMLMIYRNKKDRSALCQHAACQHTIFQELQDNVLCRNIKIKKNHQRNIQAFLMPEK